MVAACISILIVAATFATAILLVLFVGRQKLTGDFGMTSLRSFLTKLAGIDDSLNASAGLTQVAVISTTSPY
jgi:hypothetical protein